MKINYSGLMRADRRDKKKRVNKYGRFNDKDFSDLEKKKEQKRKDKQMQRNIKQKEDIIGMNFDGDLIREVNRLRALLKNDDTNKGKTLRRTLAHLFVLYSENKIKYGKELSSCVDEINKYLSEV